MFSFIRQRSSPFRELSTVTAQHDKSVVWPHGGSLRVCLSHLLFSALSFELQHSYALVDLRYTVGISCRSWILELDLPREVLAEGIFWLPLFWIVLLLGCKEKLHAQPCRTPTWFAKRNRQSPMLLYHHHQRLYPSFVEQYTTCLWKRTIFQEWQRPYIHWYAIWFPTLAQDKEHSPRVLIKERIYRTEKKIFQTGSYWRTLQFKQNTFQRSSTHNDCIWIATAVRNQLHKQITPLLASSFYY